MDQIPPIEIATVNIPPVLRAGLREILDLSDHALLPVDDVGSWVDRHPSGLLIVFVRHVGDVGSLIDTCAVAKPNSATVTVVALIDEASESLIRDCVRAGALAAIALEWTGPKIALALRAATLQMALLPHSLLKRLVEATPAPPLSLPFSERQLKWLQNMAAGQTIAELADREGYSEREMYRQLNLLYSEMGVNNRTEALVLGAKWGVVDSSVSPPDG